MLFKAEIPSLPFFKWLRTTKENRLLLIASALIIIIQFIWFKILYPYPNFFPDSYEYIAGAIENRIIDYRPIGYSKFLQLIHLLTSSHIFLVIVQYVMLQAGLLYFLFTIKYMLHPGRWVFRILLICCLLNPMMPQVSNLVSSDPLFTALSLIWLTQLLWIIVMPNFRILLLHGVVLLLVFIVRYNALYYPVISILIIIFSQTSLRAKVIIIAFTILLLGSFIGFTRYQFKKITGVAQFAPFSGWQTVANALVAYYHAPFDSPESVPTKFKILHTRVNNYMDSLHRVSHNPVIESAPYFMWGNKSPILRYMGSDLRINNNLHPEFKQWSAIAPFYAEYGKYLIKRHPGLYAKYYVARNLESYNKPSPEYLGMYNMTVKTIGPAAVKWFQLSGHTITNNYKRIASMYTIAFGNGILNILLALGFVGFSGLGGFKKCNIYCKRIICWSILIWICNLGFTVLASPISLRYLTFQLVLTFLLLTLFLEFIVREYKIMITEQKTLPNTAPA